MQRTLAAVAALALLAFLSACVSSYKDRCLQQGHQSGSPEFNDCVDSEIEQGRLDRKRHRVPGRGR